jgi:hypothetical protein
MKLKTLFISSSFTCCQALRAYLARYNNAVTRRDNAQADASSRRAEHAKLKAARVQAAVDCESGAAPSADEDRALAAKMHELEVLAGIADATAVQIDATLPGIVPDIARELLRFINVVAPVANKARTALAEYVARQMLPLFDGDQTKLKDMTIERAIDSIVDAMPAHAAFRIETNFLSMPRPDAAYVLPRAEETLASFEKFTAALRTYSKFLPDGFAAAELPKNTDEFDNAIPEKYRNMTVAQPVEARALTEKERGEKDREFQKGQLIAAYQAAQRRGDEREMERLKSFMGSAWFAEIPNAEAGTRRARELQAHEESRAGNRAQLEPVINFWGR